MRNLGIFLMVLLVWGWGYGAEYYVSKTGNDSNPGTASLPWKTLQKAANTLTAGNTVYIKAGTYNERLIPGNSGSAGKYITYTAYASDTVVIDGSGIDLPYDWGGLVDISNRSYIKISGLQIKNAGPNYNNQGILVDNSAYIIIENNYTYNTTSSGIGVWVSDNITIDGNEVVLACNGGEQECITMAITGNFEIKNNHVHHSGPSSIGGEGIDAKDGSSNGKVYNNRVHDLYRLGIYVDAWDKHTYNIQVYNNIVYNINGNDCYTLASERGGLLENISIYNNIGYNADVRGLCISINGDVSNHPMKNITVINNTFFNNGRGGWGGGIAADNPDIQNLVIRNNIISQNTTFQMVVDSSVPMSKLTVDHNLIHGYRDYIDEIKGSDYVEGDPLFVNAAGANFHLKENSPAIDSGSSTNAPAGDYEGNSRPQGNGYDIGAYEYVVSNGQDQLPFGEFDTPEHGSTVRSSVPVTGWALDDIAVESVKIYREPVPGEGSGAVYIGEAVFVEGARPDIQSYYPDYPNNSRAGWGYMMLTNFLPGQGNGTFTLYAVARDSAGHEVTLGSKTITCDNANAVKPFGAIDTPTQGGIASGTGFINWGWVLTPMPNSIPGNGSTINVYVNGVNLGHPTYNIYRQDIAALFPGYANSNGAAGYFYLDTTAYADGVHTLQWTVMDNAGNTDGIGSRYFSIQNSGHRQEASGNRGVVPPRLHSGPVRVIKGYNNDIEPQTIYPGKNGIINIEIKELERVVIHLLEPALPVEQRTLNISPLPIGSTLDRGKGIFYWQPGPGFLGEHIFNFIIRAEDGTSTCKTIVIKISAKFSKSTPAAHISTF